ncbi:MAG: secretin N-terminal domain-containing protein [Candidatus Omnitrophota bacterium]
MSYICRTLINTDSKTDEPGWKKNRTSDVRFFKGIIFLIILSFIMPNAGFCQAKISLDVKGMDVVDVLKILSDEGGFNLSISGSVSGRVTLFLKNIDVWDALEIVLISSRLAYEKKGEIICVTAERDYELKYGKKFWDEKKVSTFSFKHAKAIRVKELFSQMVSNIGKVIVDEPTNTLVVIDIPERISEMREIVKEIDKPLETKVFELNYIKVEDLESKLVDILTEGIGALKIDSASSKVIVTDYPKKLQEIEEIIKAFDEKPLQVLIDAKIVEITPSKNFYSGISWDYWIQKYFKMTGVFNLPYSTTTDRITIGTNGSTASEKGEYRGMLDFLQTFGEAKVLSTPRVLALNNQEAKILVGTKEAYITSTTSAVGDNTVRAQSVNFVDVGVKLYVTPTINKEKYITLKIRPEVSTSERASITSDNVITQIPIVTTSEAETSLIVKNGVSIFLAGLRRINRDKQRKQVPILGDIPVLGYFFRSNEDEWAKNELVIILTPYIVSGDKPIEVEICENSAGQMWEAAAKEELKKEEKTYEEWKKLGAKYLEISDQKKEIEIQELSVKDDYYSEIMAKVKQTASSFKVQYKGKVRVRFSVSNKGELLGEPAITFSRGNKNLARIAKRIIKQASPFTPFPESKKEKKETYEILMAF